MAWMWIPFVVWSMIAIHRSTLTKAEDVLDIGVCYGLLGDNLPPPKDVVALYKRYGIARMRLYDPNPAVFEALRGQLVKVTVSVQNEDIQYMASGQAAAESWFSTFIEPYINDVPIQFIVVGNEVIPGPIATYVAPAMQNLINVLLAHNLPGIRVTTAVGSSVLQNTYPPSASEFTPAALGPLKNILKVIAQQPISPVLMVNLYPYFAYAGDPAHVRLDYALFTATEPVVTDGGLNYYSLFGAMLDGVYWAMEKAGFPKIGVAVSESGWPSAGNANFTTPQLASVYNKNLLRHAVNYYGTPKRPNTYINVFIFAMFNEDLKPAGVEQNWGLFYPNKQPVYSLFPTG